ncbi:hypothetical protein LOD99_5419 [Oopsacas minuta]|uniref:Uncharacterized protein n=1 Tax=Oopsacas minuta TaxID=111878 RepID=A0AAV7JQM3_9METZ|nr:hypothetical protein LOD99_5419 [Oopsacas minuta]
MDILRETLDIGAGNCKELQNNLVNIVGPNLNVVKNHKYLNFSEESTKPCPTISPLSVKKVMPTANSQSSAPKVVKKIINSSSMLYANASTKQSGNTSPKITSNASTNMSGNATTELSGHPSTKAGNDSPIENLRLIDSCPINSVPNSIVPKVLSVLDQYSQDEWFRELFPRHQTTPFKGDISGYNCIQVIISACTNIFSCKVIICTLRAILQIVKQLSFSIVEKQKCGRLVIQMLFNSQLFDMPLPQEENYILTMLTILNELCSQDDYMYISLLLVEYILGEFETRSYITKVLQGYGFFDSFHYLSKEFDSWDMNHMHVSRKRFLFEQTIKWLKNISTGNYYLKPFENCPTSSSSKSLHECSCIEALNSFVVFKREENFGMTKEVVSEDHVPTPIHDDKYSDHRTVFSLPKISYSEKVIRIGETFVSKCHGERESTLLNYQMLPRLNLFRKNLSRNLFLQIPVHDQKISLPLDCDPNGQTLTIKRKYFVSSESQLL